MLTFADVCLITDDVPGLTTFYEKLFDCRAQGDEIHAFLFLPGLGLAIYSKDAAKKDDPKGRYSGSSDCFYIGFHCEDAQTEYERIKRLCICTPTEPQIWPWGAKSFSCKDPDGNRIVIRSWPNQSK